MSTGFRTLASAGRKARRAFRVLGSRAASSRPAYSHASAAMMPGPPAFVRIATRFPAGTGWDSSRTAVSNSSSIVLVRITPLCRNSASTAASEPASAPVWDDAAREPPGVRPLFTAMIGFVRATRRASWVNLAGFPNDSR